MSYSYTAFQTGRGRKKNGGNRRLLFISILLFLLAILIFFLVLLYTDMKHKSEEAKALHDTYREMYDNGNYADLIEQMDKQLKDNSLHSEYLIFRGFSYFLLGESDKDYTKRNLYFSQALEDLRKSLAVGIPNDVKPDVLFCIGKMYYFFGRVYYNQSIDYLNRALQSGNERVDLLYVLGLVYTSLTMYSESNEILLRSLEIEHSALASLAVASNYMNLKDYAEALKYGEKTLKISVDSEVNESAYMLIAQASLESGKYDKALKTLETVVEINENNADALYMLGEVYADYYKDTIKARAMWRKVLSINPSHIKAYRRL